MKLLLVVDASGCVLRTFQTALELVKGCGGEIILLYMVQDIALSKEGKNGFQDPVLQNFHIKAQETINKLRKMFKAKKIKVKTSLIVNEDLVEGILRIAKKEKVDRIVIGSRNLAGSPQYLPGSVLHRLILHAGCPVLVVFINKKRGR